uniref:Uncharacterized protein n=1 Tax=Favella ehrenbergii TaxID=182087 RepID=A0A7S3MS18_9SPIT
MSLVAIIGRVLFIFLANASRIMIDLSITFAFEAVAMAASARPDVVYEIFRVVNRTLLCARDNLDVDERLLVPPEEQVGVSVGATRKHLLVPNSPPAIAPDVDEPAAAGN